MDSARQVSNILRPAARAKPGSAGSVAIRVTAQIRHRHQAAAATARALGDGHAEIVFDAPQIAITPGQAVVFYDGDTVVGGGWID